MRANDRNTLLDLAKGNQASLNAFDNSGITPLMVAIDTANTDEVSILLESGADPNLAMSDGSTPLMVAAGRGSAEIAEILIRGGADIRATRDDGATALQLAEETGHESVLTLLRNVMRAQNERDISGALFDAVLNSDLEGVNMLLALGADAKITNRHQWNPLLLAVSTGDLPIVETLVSADTSL